MGYKKQEVEWKYTGADVQKNIIDLVRTSYIPDCHIRKISKNEYITGTRDKDGIFLSDGIVYEVKPKPEGIMRNRRSLRQIFRNLRQLIATNYSGGKSELFCTLTYAEQHNDPIQIYKDLDLFWKRLKYKIHSLKYIAIIEPHASGMFHVHLLLAKTDGTELYIPNSDLEQIWGKGYTQVERLEDIDHMGAYFIAYFTNMELPLDEAEKYAKEDDIEIKNGKAYIKGKRLDMYPENMRIYRHSANCDKPIKIKGEEVEKALQGAERRYSHEKIWEEDGREYHILTEQYMKK